MAPQPTSIAFFPRFTTLVGATSFATAPMDVAGHTSVRLQAWRGDLRGASPGFELFLEESLNAEDWVLGPSAPVPYTIASAGDTKSLNCCFQLRWFRVRVVLSGTNPMVTCWIEGLLA